MYTKTNKEGGREISRDEGKREKREGEARGGRSERYEEEGRRKE